MWHLVIQKNRVFGIETGIHTEGYKQIDGWQLGVVLSKQFRWNWSVSAGLNFRKTVISTKNSNNSNLKLEYYQGAVDKNASTSFPALTASARLTLNNLNYLELPLSVNYHINNKWSVLGGIKTSYLVNVHLNQTSDSTLYIFNQSAKQETRLSLDANSKSELQYLGLKRWDFSVIGGIYFKPIDKIQLSLRYDYGFKNTLNRPNWSAYNRFLGVNVSYYFR